MILLCFVWGNDRARYQRPARCLQILWAWVLTLWDCAPSVRTPLGLWSPSIPGLAPLAGQPCSCCSLTLLWANWIANHSWPVSEMDPHKALLFSRMSSCLAGSWRDVKRMTVHDALGCSVLSIFSERYSTVVTDGKSSYSRCTSWNDYLIVSSYVTWNYVLYPSVEATHYI